MHLWLDGQLLSAAAACLPWDDRGLLLGEGIFETLLVLRGRPIEQSAHLARLASSARALSLPLPWTEQELAEAIAAVLAANREALQETGAGALRLTLTGGSGPRGLFPPPDPCPRLLIGVAPIERLGRRPPAAVAVAPFRLAPASPLRGHKTLSALEAVWAARDARARGADEALFLAASGHLVEAAAANLFLVDAAGRLLTPPLSDGALPGITRARVLRLAEQLGIPAEQGRSLSLSDLAGAGEAFLSNSLIGIRPLESLHDEGSPLASWQETPRPITMRLHAALWSLWEDMADRQADTGA